MVRVLMPVARGNGDRPARFSTSTRGDALPGEGDGGDEAGRAGTDDEHRGGLAIRCLVS